ncbi:MAG: apolipoprotein N-acyltransferase [Acidobacteria bacterium]|nr:apolipoprotein N-acyltransferase [Acidobacteriota bacterium]
MTGDASARWRRIGTLAGLSVLSGTLYFLGFAGFNQWYFAPLAFVPFAEMLRRAGTGKAAFWLGWLMGTVTHLGGYYWIPATLTKFGGFPLPLALLFDVVLCSWGGLSFGLLGWGLKRWWMAGGKPFPSLAVAVVFIEFAYPLLFPSYLANSFWQLPVVIQVCDLGGPLLLSAVVVFLSTALWLSLRWALAREPFPRLPAAVAGLLVLGTVAYGLIRLPQVDENQEHATPLRVGLVQANMGTYQKRDDPEEGHRRHLTDSLALQAEGVDLLIWPESAYVFLLPARTGSNVRPLVLQRPDVAGELHTPLLFGALRREEGGGDRPIDHNTAFLVDAAGTVQGTYDKTYLLAFGEYLPFGDTFPWLYSLSPHSGRFTPGSRLDALPFGSHRIGVLVCYEDVLPGFTRKLVRASEPDLLVNITNDAWFGETTEPEIHLALSVFRAVEHRRWLVRATNSGISALIDPAGRVVASTGLATRETLRGTVRWQHGTTLYTVLGDWPGWLALAAVAWAFYRLWRHGHLRFRRHRDERGVKVKKARQGAARNA